MSVYNGDARVACICFFLVVFSIPTLHPKFQIQDGEDINALMAAAEGGHSACLELVMVMSAIPVLSAPSNV